MTNDGDSRPWRSRAPPGWIRRRPGRRRWPRIGAGAIHAAAIGIHAEHATLVRLFVAVAAAQLAAGVVMLVRGGRATAGATVHRERRRRRRVGR